MRPLSHLSTLVYTALFLQIISPVGAWPLAPEPSKSANFTQCQENIRNRTLAYEPYWVDIHGQRTFNRLEIVGTDIGTCTAYCGSSPSPFQWSSFSPQFTGWLLPFLALLAQLPYESNGIWHNLMCLFLTVGSPPLAMYSLALTLLNSRYAKQLLDELPVPKDPEENLQFTEFKASVFQTLKVSQQEPFGVAARTATSSEDFAIVRSWWRSVHHSLKKSARWFTASLATQAAWAIIAFAFTWVDAFGSSKIGTKVTAYGLAIALCWSWVTVIVLGWFFAGVSLSHSPITDAIEQADHAHEDAFPRITTHRRERNDQDRSHFAISRPIAGDVEHAGPVYNYARLFVWSHMVYHIVEIIRQQANRPRIVVSQDHGSQVENQQNKENTPEIQAPLTPKTTSEVRTSVTSPSSRSSVQEYPPAIVGMNRDVERGHGSSTLARYLWQDAKAMAQWKRDAYGRMAWAIVCAIVLNVLTVGSAFGLDFATPSVGLGCRSGGVIIYWMTSYVILIVLILAALISDHWSVREATKHHYKTPETISRRVLYRLLGNIAVALRLFGKLLACLNSIWIVLHCLFEFTQFYDRCYCLTNRGTTFWLWFDDAELRSLGNTQRFWVGFASATGITCMLYISFMLGWTMKRL